MNFIQEERRTPSSTRKLTGSHWPRLTELRIALLFLLKIEAELKILSCLACLVAKSFFKAVTEALRTEYASL